MDWLLAFVYLCVCLYFVWKMCYGKDIIFAHLGILAVFSIAYYPLPVFLQSMSPLGDYSDEQIFSALAIHWVFLLAILLGIAGCWKYSAFVRPLEFGGLDTLATRYMFPLALAGCVLYFAYFLTNDISGYSSEDFSAFFEQKNVYRQILSAFAGLSVAAIALSFAYAVKRARRIQIVMLGVIIAAVVITSFSTAARIVIISPLIMVFVGLFVTGQRIKALQAILAVIIILVTVSPIVVFIRQHRSAFSSKEDVVNTANDFSFSGNVFSELVQGVVGRSDLLYVTINMKELIDRIGYVGWQFYYSVAVVPVPRLIYTDKPYVLSDNGRIDGEISVLAWQSLEGGLGSLTAFGGLVAYREGGWIAVVLDGLAAGAFFLFLARWLGRGGFIANLFYLNIFVQVAAAKAPASFFEALAGFLGLAPLILILFLISRLFVRKPSLRRLALRTALPTLAAPKDRA